MVGDGLQTALITGASGGIGYELARLCAADGYRLVLVARSADKLAAIRESFRQVFRCTVVPFPCDLADPEAPSRIYAEMERQGIGVDVLVNNAGFATYGRFAETDLTAELEMLQVNVVALTHLTKLFLRPMLARGAGRIMNVASTAAFQPGPLMAVYYASKAYVLSVSEALANEVRGTGVTVTAFCPGATRSGFHARAGMEQSRLLRFGMMEASMVAGAGYRGMLAGKPIVIPGLRNRLTVLAAKCSPRGLVTRVVRWVQEERE